MIGAPPSAGTAGSGAMVGPLDNRFHVISVACLRVMQIRSGGRVRIEASGHKPCVVAVAEVVAGVVPYYLSEKIDTAS
jgi:DNA-directed RNA polymerase subunit K/omega